MGLGRLATHADHPPPKGLSGPARIVAVAFLGALCALGLGWSIITGRGETVRVIQANGHAAGTAEAREPVTANRAAATPVIDLNTASAGELELLPGIGPAMAQRIIDDRAARGPFRSLNDLDRVRGIGPRTLDALRNKVTTVIP